MNLAPIEHDEQKSVLPLAPLAGIAILLTALFLMWSRLPPAQGDSAAATTAAGGPDASQLPTIKIILRADGQGNLAAALLNQRPMKDLDALRAELLAIVRAAGGPGRGGAGPEIALDCDPNLRYEHTLRAIAAVSEDPSGELRLAQKIKFAPRSRASKEGGISK